MICTCMHIGNGDKCGDGSRGDGGDEARQEVQKEGKEEEEGQASGMSGMFWMRAAFSVWLIAFM